MKKRYRLYIDESGDHTYKVITDPYKRYLGLTGCLIEDDHYKNELQPNLEKFKQKFIPHNPDDPIILHRDNILNKRGLYKILKDPKVEQLFSEALLDFFAKHEFTIISVVIDKLSYFKKYGEKVPHPYHLCMTILLDRYCWLLHYLGGEGDVMVEPRGSQEDKSLNSAYQSIFKSGTQFRTPDCFQSALTKDYIKIKSKAFNIAGLQLADLLAYPCRKDILILENCIQESNKRTFGGKLIEVINNKFNRNMSDGRVKGYGKIFLK